MSRILLVEDEAAIRKLVAAVLARDGHEALATASAAAALALLAQGADAAILDLGLPDRDGLELIAAIRARSAMPLLVLSARDATEEKIAALDLGADDYLTKPFDGDELLARLRAALRRAGATGERDGILRHGALTLDAARHEVTLDATPVALTPREFALLELLMRAGGRVLTHAQMLKSIWGPAHVEDVEYLRVAVRSLRRKLERDPSNPQLIRNEPGIGYRLGASPGV